MSARVLAAILVAIGLPLIFCPVPGNKTADLATWTLLVITPSTGPYRGTEWDRRYEGDFAVTGASVDSLIEDCYPSIGTRVVNAPGWTRYLRYDIRAKAESLGDLATCAILRQKFGFKAHMETRQVPVYRVVVADSGLKMKRSAWDQANTTSDWYYAAIDLLDPLNPVWDTTSTSPDGVSVQVLSGQSVRTHAIFEAIMRHSDHSIVSFPDLDGFFDFELKFAVQNGGKTPKQHTAPSLVQAAEEQLGLKFESSTVEEKFLIVDWITHPAADCCFEKIPEPHNKRPPAPRSQPLARIAWAAVT